VSSHLEVKERLWGVVFGKLRKRLNPKAQRGGGIKLGPR